MLFYHTKYVLKKQEVKKKKEDNAEELKQQQEDNAEEALQSLIGNRLLVM